MLNSSTGPEMPVISAPADGRHYQVLGDDITCLFNGHGAGSSWALFTIESPRGGLTPPHLHETYDEAMYVIDGRIEVQIGDRAAVIGPGHFVHIPKDTLHALKNVGDEPARFLSWSLPGLAEAFFAEVDGASRRRPQSLEDIVAIAARHGIRAML